MRWRDCERSMAAAAAALFWFFFATEMGGKRVRDKENKNKQGVQGDSSIVVYF